jgi:hypothetical protein
MKGGFCSNHFKQQADKEGTSVAGKRSRIRGIQNVKQSKKKKGGSP